MMWIVLTLLLGIGVVGMFATYSLVVGGILIAVICAVAAFGIHRIWRMRAGRLF